MKIYHHAQNGEYLYASAADENPLEPDAFLIPANATMVEPPSVKSREIAIFDVTKNAWDVVPDWRGVPLYRTADGSAVTLTEIGQTPEDVAATETPPPDLLHEWADADGWVLSAPKVAAAIKRALAVRLAALNAECERQTSAVRADTPTDEVQSWGKQESEARALIADPNAATPLLSAIAAARGVPIDLLAAKVIDKSDAYAAYTGALIGTRQALEDLLMSIDLTAPDALAQIDAVQWPEATP